MMTKRSRTTHVALTILVLFAAAGCSQHQSYRHSPPLPPLAMPDAIAVVNENASRIHGAMRATGNADGHFIKARGGRASYHVDATLFYMPPQYLRFDLKKLGDRQFLFGSNDQYYWVYSKADDQYECHPHSMGSSATGSTVQAAQLADALGLSPITGLSLATDGSGAAHAGQPVQRVTGDMQQILVPGSGRTAEREYWLDRRAPRLIRRVIFRDAQGRVVLESSLDDYRPLSPGGPQVPYKVQARWPADDADIRFNVSQWSPADDVTGSGPQFATPRECLSPGSQ